MFPMCCYISTPHKNVGAGFHLCEYSTLPKGKTFITQWKIIL